MKKNQISEEFKVTELEQRLEMADGEWTVKDVMCKVNETECIPDQHEF